MEPHEHNNTPETDTTVDTPDTSSPETDAQDHTTDTGTSDAATEHTSASDNNSTPEGESGGIDHNAIMGILCYLGPLVLVPYLTERENPFVKFHIKQGLVLLGFAILSFLISSFSGLLFIFAIFLIPLIILFNLFLLILVIIGIVNAVKGAQKPLPLIGGLARKIKI